MKSGNRSVKSPQPFPQSAASTVPDFFGICGSRGYGGLPWTARTAASRRARCCCTCFGALSDAASSTLGTLAPCCRGLCVRFEP